MWDQLGVHFEDKVIATVLQFGAVLPGDVGVVVAVV